ncbi:MAG: polysaccharide deacetylase family protein [bacterium]|nr:polysaccharide deacetylase family protein [bacterium]
MTSMAMIATALIGMMCAAGDEAAADKPVPPLKAPGLVMTFDDTTVANWVAAMPVFEKHDARGTFFITRVDTFTQEQWDGLHKLHKAGHAIGCHGLRHVKANEYAEKHGLDKYMQDEIKPALRIMTEKGLVPTSFAYPMSARTEATDAALRKHFRHLRGGAFPEDGQRLAEMNGLFTPLDGVRDRVCLLGRSLDGAGEPRRAGVIDELQEAFERAKQNNEIVVFYAHNIGSEGRNHITPDGLGAVLGAAREAGLKFYTYDDLP